VGGVEAATGNQDCIVFVSKIVVSVFREKRCGFDLSALELAPGSSGKDLGE